MNWEKLWVTSPKTKRLYLVQSYEPSTYSVTLFDLKSGKTIWAVTNFIALHWLQVGDTLKITGKSGNIYLIRILDFVWSKKENTYKVKYTKLAGKENNFSYGLLSRVEQNFLTFID